MNQNPLTDPTSLIAYRLANGESSPHVKRQAGTAAEEGRRNAFGAIVALGLLLGGMTVLVCIFS